VRSSFPRACVWLRATGLEQTRLEGCVVQWPTDDAVQHFVGHFESLPGAHEIETTWKRGDMEMSWENKKQSEREGMLAARNPRDGCILGRGMYSKGAFRASKASKCFAGRSCQAEKLSRPGPPSAKTIELAQAFVALSTTGGGFVYWRITYDASADAA